MVNLTGLSFAYPDVPARDRTSLVDPEVPLSYPDIFVLSTCLRVEIAWLGGPETVPEVMHTLYASLSSRSLPAARVRSGHEEFHHLARVAAGLDSVPVGEAEILTQFRRALKHLVSRTGENGELAGVVKAALGVGRGARRALDCQPEGSLAAAAAAMIGGLPRVAVLGSGAMARAVVERLDPNSVDIYARRPGSVAGVHPRPWTEARQALSEAPAVVSTVPGPLFCEDAIPSRRRPLLFIDLGMPPALAPPATTHTVDYRGVDDVAASVPAVPAVDAEELAARDGLSVWQRLMVSDRAGGIITSLVDRAEQAVDEEVRRVVGRFETAVDPETVLRQLGRSVARRLLHPPVSYVGSVPLDQDKLDVVARAFGIEDA